MNRRCRAALQVNTTEKLTSIPMVLSRTAGVGQHHMRVEALQAVVQCALHGTHRKCVACTAQRAAVQQATSKENRVISPLVGRICCTSHHNGRPVPALQRGLRPEQGQGCQ